MAVAYEPRSEFSRPMLVERIGGSGLTEEIAADPTERAALAKRFGLLGLDRLSATLRLERADGKGLIRVTGRFVAEVTQACVVTLEPVSSRIEVAFSLLYSVEAAPVAPRGGEVMVASEEEDPPEPVGPEGIDLGEAAAQQLALALDPYPRAPGAAIPQAARDETRARPTAEGPFAPLSSLKHRE